MSCRPKRFAAKLPTARLAAGIGKVHALALRPVAARLPRQATRFRGFRDPPVARARLNPKLTDVWFGTVMGVIHNATMLTIIVGACFFAEARLRFRRVAAPMQP